MPLGSATLDDRFVAAKLHCSVDFFLFHPDVYSLAVKSLHYSGLHQPL